MADKKLFLDFAGLSQYDELIKAYIDGQNAEDQSGLNDVIADLAAAKDRITANETQIAANEAQIAENKSAIEVLNGDGEGSVSKSVSDAIAALVNSAPETFDTLKEIADWIDSDETASAKLVERITANENAIENLQNADVELKAYVDKQDQEYYNLIGSVSANEVKTLFMVKKTVESGQTVSDAIAALGENQMLVLEADCAEDLDIPASAVIDANGNTMSGNIKVAEGATILNATFTGKVTVE